MPILMLCRVHYRIHLNYNLHKGVLAWLFTGKKTWSPALLILATRRACLQAKEYRLRFRHFFLISMVLQKSHLFCVSQVVWAEHQHILVRTRKDGIPSDPKFRDQWYLVSIPRLCYKTDKIHVALRLLIQQQITNDVKVCQ